MPISNTLSHKFWKIKWRILGKRQSKMPQRPTERCQRKTIEVARVLHTVNWPEPNFNSPKSIACPQSQERIKEKVKNSWSSVQNHRSFHHWVLGLILRRYWNPRIKNKQFPIIISNINELHTTKWSHKNPQNFGIFHHSKWKEKESENF